MWIIIRASDYRQWGSDEYPTEESAKSELKSFWKGTPVDFKKFKIVEKEQAPKPVARTAY